MVTRAQVSVATCEDAEANAQILLALGMVGGAGRVTLHRAQAIAQGLGTPLASLCGQPVARLLRLLPGAASPLAEVLAACTPKLREAAGRLLRRVYAAGGVVLPVGQAGYPDDLIRFLV